MLCVHIDSARFPFDTTQELEDLEQDIGQERAIEAIRFGVGIGNHGYNIYALGPSGTGKHHTVRRLLEGYAAERDSPLWDWCYVNNFKLASKPHLLRLPAGRGARLSDDMQQLVEELRVAIPAAFESDEYLLPLREIEESFEKQEQEAFSTLNEEAARNDIRVIQRPGQFTFSPQHKGQPLAADDFKALPEKERKRIEDAIDALQKRLEDILEKRIPQWRRESRARVKELNRKITMVAVGHIIRELRESYQDLPNVLHYLDQVQDDVIEHIDAFRKQADQGEELSIFNVAASKLPQRYQVNLLVNNGEGEHAPVIYEDNPSFSALLGRIEHTAQLGTLITDFTQIKAGALHKANGGYLMLDIHKLLTQPYAWDGLKRVLLAGEIRIESLAHILSLVSTASLEPEPVPLDIKIVLLGERWIYYLLNSVDPDFAELFKVAADFDTSLIRSDEGDLMYARLVATLARKHELRAFHRSAVAALMRFSMRQVEDTRRLSTHLRTISDLMQESSYWAGEAGHEAVVADDVQRAYDAQVVRHSRSRDRVQEAIARGILMIDSQGAQVGQINALTVIDLGNFSYGIPARITATTRLGEGELIDIEREAELGGRIHSKGVFILSSFLGARYSRDVPLSLAASLTIEQSYADVEGDSASLAELCALLSSLAGVALKQSFAVTGSVNQLGRVQAIGGVNDKIEGFFDICKQRGLNGEQGVIIPASNVEHLMLREDIVDAARAGRFAIYPASDVDTALELLTDVEAGERDEQGMFPPESFNGRVQTRLIELATVRHAFAEAARGQVRAGEPNGETGERG